MSRVMCVGTATLDIVNSVSRYPSEDSEVRAISQTQRVGGNAANTAMVLAQLGTKVTWVGNLAQPAGVIEETFEHYGVDASNATHTPNAVTPTSYILVSEATGSRSIVHYRDLPEYRADAFVKLDLVPFQWVHFEGRAIDQLLRMIRHARANLGLAVSLEVEKPRSGIEGLFDQVDLALFSRDYAEARGFTSAEELLLSLPHQVAPATCTWGASGAWAIDRDGGMFHAPAPALTSVVDTIGAGDVFNAAMIHALSAGRAVEQALHTAVALASRQCTREGLTLPAE